MVHRSTRWQQRSAAVLTLQTSHHLAAQAEEFQFVIAISDKLGQPVSDLRRNRRMYSNLTASDQLNIGCDRFNGVESMRECQEAALEYVAGPTISTP